MITYNIITGDTITAVVIRLTGIDPESFWARRELIIVLFTVFVTLPLSLYKYSDFLAK